MLIVTAPSPLGVMVKSNVPSPLSVKLNAVIVPLPMVRSPSAKPVTSSPKSTLTGIGLALVGLVSVLVI
jgi:hypothetical protein